MKCVYQYDDPHESYLYFILYFICIFLYFIKLYKKGIAWLSSIYVLKWGYCLWNIMKPFLYALLYYNIKGKDVKSVKKG